MIEERLAIAALGGFFSGIAYADFVVTWKQQRHISIDAIYLSALAGLCVLALIILP